MTMKYGETKIPPVLRRTRNDPLRILATIVFLGLFVRVAQGQEHTRSSLTPSGPIFINGQNGTVISGLRITSTTGDCVKIVSSSNVTIQNSEIGPCGKNNTTFNSIGIYVTGGTGNKIYDNYIHVENLASGCCDTHSAILTDGTVNISIQGNVIAYGESNIEITNGTNGATILGNFLLNPRGPYPRGQNVQALDSSNITVLENYLLSSTSRSYIYPENQEDAINIYDSNTFTVKNNYITGGHSASGCGIVIDYQSNYGNILSNILANTGQCGIGVADGVGHVIDSNKILNLTPVVSPDAGNVALYVWKRSSKNRLGCGGSNPSYQIRVSNNVADELKPDGVTHSGWWNGGGCDPIMLVSNTWNKAAYNVLYPMTSTNRPPLIPPQPYDCVASSPYSTQTSHPPCKSNRRH
jgi:hypothetical protein